MGLENFGLGWKRDQKVVHEEGPDENWDNWSWNLFSDLAKSNKQYTFIFLRLQPYTTCKTPPTIRSYSMNKFIFVLYSRLNLKIEPIAYLRIKIDKPTGWILLNSYSNFRTKALHSKVYKSSIMGHSTRVASFKGQGNSGQVGFYIIPISWVFQKFANPKDLKFRIFVGLRSWFLWLPKEFLKKWL